MLLKENEVVFQDYEWTTNGDARIPNSNVKLVSPFFNSAGCSGECKHFRFAIRLIGNSFFEKFQTVVYFYVHNVHQLGIQVKAVDCQVNGKTIHLETKFSEETILKVFKSDEFLTYEHLSEKGIHLKYRVYMANNNFRNSFYGFELRDANYGEEMWSAAQKGLLTDCEFAIENQIFSAHRVVVAARCPVLSQRIDREGINNGQIVIRDATDPVVFKALLYFLYTGHLISMTADCQRQFTALASKYEVKTVEQIQRIAQSINKSGELTRIFLAIQPKLKSDLSVEIRENHGRVSVVGRGICLHYNYVRSFKPEEAIAPEVYRFDEEGFFGVTLTEQQHKNGHGYQLTFASFHLAAGFKLGNVTFSKDGSTHFNMPQIFEESGESFKVFREGFSLPRHSDNSPYYVHIRFTVYLTEIDDSWGYRLNDPHLPVQLWSSVKKSSTADVELRVGNRSFPAHRAILSARSSVFAAMFYSSDQSRIESIHIANVDPNIFEDFLVFLYTGRLRKMGNVDQLWVAANKYEVKALERICESVRTRPGIEELSLRLMSSL